MSELPEDIKKCKFSHNNWILIRHWCYCHIDLSMFTHIATDINYTYIDIAMQRNSTLWFPTKFNGSMFIHSPPRFLSLSVPSVQWSCSLWFVSKLIALFYNNSISVLKIRRLLTSIWSFPFNWTFPLPFFFFDWKAISTNSKSTLTLL